MTGIHQHVYNILASAENQIRIDIIPLQPLPHCLRLISDSIARVASDNYLKLTVA